jgi:hypothetical protein
VRGSSPRRTPGGTLRRRTRTRPQVRRRVVAGWRTYARRRAGAADPRSIGRAGPAAGGRTVGAGGVPRRSRRVNSAAPAPARLGAGAACSAQNRLPASGLTMPRIWPALGVKRSLLTPKPVLLLDVRDVHGTLGGRPWPGRCDTSDSSNAEGSEHKVAPAPPPAMAAQAGGSCRVTLPRSRCDCSPSSATRSSRPRADTQRQTSRPCVTGDPGGGGAPVYVQIHEARPLRRGQRAWALLVPGRPWRAAHACLAVR